MAENDSHKATLEVAATAGSVPEADLICQRLAEAGIRATTQRSIGGPQWGVSGGQYIYVEAEHLDRACEILAAPTGISDDDLAEMAEDAVPTQQTQPKGIDPKTGKPHEPIEIPVPKVSTIRAAIRKVAQPIEPGDDRTATTKSR